MVEILSVLISQFLKLCCDYVREGLCCRKSMLKSPRVMGHHISNCLSNSSEKKVFCVFFFTALAAFV